MVKEVSLPRNTAADQDKWVLVELLRDTIDADRSRGACVALAGDPR
jgi:hypothetical protein